MSSSSGDDRPRFIWATRGRDWGFRFLRKAGIEDPLATYEAAFEGDEDAPEVYRRTGGRVALRFPDPEGRRDAAGRIIPHEFVLLGPWADGFDSLDVARRRVWPEVAAEFAALWDQGEPPPARKGG